MSVKKKEIEREISEKQKEIKNNEINLLEFLEKNKITGFLRSAYLAKFSIDDEFTETEWLNK